MISKLRVIALLVCVFAFGGMTLAQNTGAAPAAQAKLPGITANLAYGELTSISAADQKMTLKTDDGDEVLVVLSAATVYKRLPAGETSPTKAVATTFAEIGVGDRVVAVGTVAADHKSVPARQVIVMSKADVAKKHALEREDWNRRGITGKVTSVDVATNQIVVAARTREGEKPITIVQTEKAAFRRYAPDSVKFSDAQTSSLAEVKVGDQLRALGNKNDDGTQYTPEEIVFGSFAMVAGAITAIDPVKGEITIKNLQTNQPMTIVTNQDSLLRKFPAEMAAMMARGQGGNGAPGNGAPGNGAPGNGAPGNGAPGNGAPGNGAPGNGAPGNGGPRRMGGDFDAMLERLPAVTLADLKKGDIIAVSSTKGSDPSRVTAIKLLAGVEAFLTAPAGPRGAAGGQAPSMNLPGLDSIGTP
jgi:hypothetical protein